MLLGDETNNGTMDDIEVTIKITRFDISVKFKLGNKIVGSQLWKNEPLTNMESESRLVNTKFKDEVLDSFTDEFWELYHALCGESINFSWGIIKQKNTPDPTSENVLLEMMGLDDIQKIQMKNIMRNGGSLCDAKIN